MVFQKSFQTKASMDTWATTLEESKLLPNKIHSPKQNVNLPYINSMDSTILSFQTANTLLEVDETVNLNGFFLFSFRVLLTIPPIQFV